MSGGTKIGYEVDELKVRCWLDSKIQKRILHFFTK